MQQKWVSINEFMRINHIIYDTVIKLVNSRKIQYKKVGKHYKIKVLEDLNVNESMKKLIRENDELKSYIKILKNILDQVEI